ncbi:MAG: hypothetical protein KF729_09575 [Sandaracinaceae bacterium]|nr:hypothetical protein [Sandaracinaceae bacterium]
MSRRGWAPIAGMIALIAALVVGWWVALRPGATPDATDEADETYERWVYGEGSGPASGQSAREPPRGVGRDPLARPPTDEARAAEWAERWRRAVQIEALGARAPTVTPDAIRAALAPSRAQLRECVGEAGGWRALFRARREQRREGATGDEPPAERGRRRSRVAFDVTPEGTVRPDSLRFDPPMPAAFAPCFEEHFLGLRLEDVGDGAHVELPMGPPSGRRNRGREGDAGVGGAGRGRWRDRGEERPARREGEGRAREGR